MSEVLSLGALELIVRRSKRRTVNLIVERDGSLVASAPLGMQISEISKIARSRELWLHSAVARRNAMTSGAAKEYVSGEGFYYLGRSYRLRVLRGITADKGWPELRLFQGKFQLRQDCVPEGRRCFMRWYSKQMGSWLSENISQLQARVGVNVRKTSVLDLGFRWASCSNAGRLNFNWRAILLPSSIISYLVLHELCHLLEHNHTEKFWSLVQCVDHQYERKEQWLRENGGRFCL
jgi:predicted metal-dependent hydrolase